MEIEKRLLSTPASRQWKQVGVRHHHGLNLPLFSLLSRKSCGIGEFLDILLLLPLCKEVGLDVLQLLPLNDTGEDSSPYNCLSAFALNPIHLSLHSLPYLEEIPPKIEVSQRIDYRAVRKVKMDFLQKYINRFKDRVVQDKEYIAFTERNADWLPAYAIFKELKRREPLKTYREWGLKLSENLIKEFDKEVVFHSIIQFLCFKQLVQVKEEAERNGIFLMGDIPILISPESADVWQYSEFFHTHLSAGSNPDIYSKEGQNWGFPLYNWDYLERIGYPWWKRRLQVASCYYDIYRIDHFVGFYRIWGIPQGQPGNQGRYIPEDPAKRIPQGERIMQMMLEVSDMLPIGEDLGDVPNDVRASMKTLGICGTKVMRWERNWEGDKRFIPFDQYYPLSLTTVSTHDSEPLELWWREYPDDVRELCRLKGWEYNSDLSLEQKKSLLFDSHHTSSLFHVNLLQEYLSLIPGLSWQKIEDERINTPGVISDLNWSYRFRPYVEDIIANQTFIDMIKKVVH